MTKFEDYWRNRSLVYATERSLALEAFEAGMKRAMEIAEREADSYYLRDMCDSGVTNNATSGCMYVMHAIAEELSECLRVHAEYSNRIEAEVKKWKLATCKWQDAHSDAEAENKQLTHALEEGRRMNTLTESETKSLIRGLREELSECMRVRVVRVFRMEVENKRLKKAIQEYLDDQTSNLWVTHFRMAMR